MIRIILITTGFVLCVSLFQTIENYSAQLDNGYTIAQVMDAYQSGQFRAISTNSTNFILNATQSHILAFGDGLYRLSDGKHYEQFIDAEFSLNGRYVAQTGLGVFHLDTEQWVVEIDADFVFSEDSKYVGVTSSGVYNLGNSQKILEVESPELRFSPNSKMVATLDGVYTLDNGQKILTTQDTTAEFSPDSLYVWTRNTGVVRLMDSAIILEITTPYDISFTPDSNYVVMMGDGTYSLSTQELLFEIDYIGLEFVQPRYSPCNEHVLIDGIGIYHLTSGQRLFETSDVKVSPNCSYIVVGNDGVYRLEDMQKVLRIDEWVGSNSEFSSNEAYLAIPGLGTYRTSDWERILDNGSFALFNSDATHMAIDWDGVYSIDDKQKLFDIIGIADRFSTDGDYLVTGYSQNSGIYRVHDGYYYVGLQLLDSFAGIMAIGNTIFVIDESIQNQGLEFAHTSDNGTRMMSEPSIDSNELLYIPKGNRFMVLEQNDSWFRVGYGGKQGWILIENTRVFVAPD